MKLDIAKYWKTVVAAGVAIGTTALTTAEALSSKGGWTSQDTIQEVLAVLGAIGVYAVPNKPAV